MALPPGSAPQKILAGVGRAAQVLLSVDDWTAYVERAMELIGEPSEADRVYNFEKSTSDEGRLVTAQRPSMSNGVDVTSSQSRCMRIDRGRPAWDSP